MPNIVLLSVNFVKSGIRTKNFGNHDSILCLIVLEQSRNDSRKSKGRTVEGVSQLRFSVSIAITQMEAVRLICLEVGY